MSPKRQDAGLANALRSAVNAVAGVLSEFPQQAMLIGGMAVIARGVPRTTRDVDATIDGNASSIEGLLESFGKHDIVARISDVVDFAIAHQVLLLRHQPSGVDINASIAWLPFELEALRAAEIVRLGNVSVPVAQPEDLIVYKAVAWRPQDQQDIERLLTLHGSSVDLVRIRRVVGEFASALDEPERLTELERIMTRVLG